MSASRKVVSVVRQWVIKAENDLRNAEHTLTLKENCPYDTVCFHAQQCVEKYLKGLLTFAGVDFPKIHDIGEIIRLVPTRFKIPIDPASQEKLTDFATVNRYPGEWEPVERTDAEAAVAKAREVRKSVREFLPKESLMLPIPPLE